MALNKRELAIALIANGIAAHTIYMENGTIPDGTTIYDFILKAIPEDLKAEVTASLIDIYRNAWISLFHASVKRCKR